MENQEKLAEFVQWLPENVTSFKGSIPDEIIEPISKAQKPEMVVEILNELSKSDKGNQIVEVLFKGFEKSESQLFKKGGKLDFGLQKFQIGGIFVRNRGTIPAYAGNVSEYSEDDPTWTKKGNANVKNIFRGSMLSQHVVTPGQFGVPRRVVRTIYNYDIPVKADTTYRDALGNEYKKHPGFFDIILNRVHSKEFVDNIDHILNGMEPIQLNEREVRKARK